MEISKSHDKAAQVGGLLLYYSFWKWYNVARKDIIMATEKSYGELQADVKKTLEKWSPLIEKCGHLENLDEKLIFANILEKMSQKSQDAKGKDYILEPDETLNVVNTTGTKRLVVEYDDNGELGVMRQRLDWVND